MKIDLITKFDIGQIVFFNFDDFIDESHTCEKCGNLHLAKTRTYKIQSGLVKDIAISGKRWEFGNISLLSPYKILYRISYENGKLWDLYEENVFLTKEEAEEAEIHCNKILTKL